MKQAHEEKIGKMDFEMSQMEQRITLLESELAATKLDAANETTKHTSVTTELQNKIHELREIIEESKTNYTKLEDDCSQQLLLRIDQPHFCKTR